MRRYRLAPYVWGAALALATATSGLRIAQDQHYFTDVLTGSLIGAGTGFALPWLLHRPIPVDVALTPIQGGSLVVVDGRY